MKSILVALIIIALFIGLAIWAWREDKENRS